MKCCSQPFCPSGHIYPKWNKVEVQVSTGHTRFVTVPPEHFWPHCWASLPSPIQIATQFLADAFMSLPDSKGVSITLGVNQTDGSPFPDLSSIQRVLSDLTAVFNFYRFHLVEKSGGSSHHRAAHSQHPPALLATRLLSKHVACLSCPVSQHSFFQMLSYS